MIDLEPGKCPQFLGLELQPSKTRSFPIKGSLLGSRLRFFFDELPRFTVKCENITLKIYGIGVYLHEPRKIPWLLGLFRGLYYPVIQGLQYTIIRIPGSLLTNQYNEK